MQQSIDGGAFADTIMPKHEYHVLFSRTVQSHSFQSLVVQLKIFKLQTASSL